MNHEKDIVDAQRITPVRGAIGMVLMTLVMLALYRDPIQEWVVVFLK